MSSAKVTVYGSPTCMPCRSTKKTLDKMGVEYDYVDVTADPTGLDTINSLGYSSVPVIVTPTGDHFQGFHPDRLSALATA
ncbi:glutaredoxin family protein [Aeromicrobium sp. 179-A 4D2 NHS]|uniref:glutaredoxin family protein n=1 Tax=Aeromicrobium sp. 179-A 4D2 NHS TaxID=3142375 RepID=UPI0039A21539